MFKFHRTSASNSAEIYNIALARAENQPADWGFAFNLRGEHIWDAISHLALLEHYERENQVLIVSHGSQHKDRLADAIRERNNLFAEQGQPEWAHYCEKCVRFFYDSNGYPECK